MFFLQNMRQVKTRSLYRCISVRELILSLVPLSRGFPGHHQDDMVKIIPGIPNKHLPLGRVFVGFFNHENFEAKKCRPQKDPTKFQTCFPFRYMFRFQPFLTFVLEQGIRSVTRDLRGVPFFPCKNPAQKATNVNTFGIKHAPGFLILGAESLSTKRAIERFLEHVFGAPGTKKGGGTPENVWLDNFWPAVTLQFRPYFQWLICC